MTVRDRQRVRRERSDTSDPEPTLHDLELAAREARRRGDPIAARRYECAYTDQLLAVQIANRRLSQ